MYAAEGFRAALVAVEQAVADLGVRGFHREAID